MPAAVASHWRDRRRLVFQSVFQAGVSQPTSQATSSNRFAEPGQPFVDPATSLTGHSLQPSRHHQHDGAPQGREHTLVSPGPGEHPSACHPPSAPTRNTSPAPSQQTAAQPAFPSLTAAANDQVTYDRAWRVVTAHIALPSSATADDSFGTLAAESQQASGRRGADSDFYDAFALVVNANTLLPRATHTDDVVAWHLRQVRSHFAQHVIPLLAGCVDDEVDDSDDVVGEQDGRPGAGRKGNYYERHMVIVMSSIRTLEAALRLYSYGLGQLLSGFSRLSGGVLGAAKDAELLQARFRRDIHALVANSASESLMRSVKVVLVRLAGTILGIPARDEPRTGSAQLVRPAPPGRDDLRTPAARERLLELVKQLYDVGLAGERFHVLFAEVMDAMMSEFVTGAYAGVWSAPDPRSFSTAMNTVSRGASLSAASPCIRSLNDWVENHFAQLSFQVLSCISPNPHGPSPVSLGDLKTFQSLALGRLAVLRIEELFDIVLAWPASRPALEDLRGSITTAARRKQLTDSFTRTLQKRLLHPGCSTLEILRTYISIIRTLHALDHSKVLLSHVEPSLQLYLCQREDAVRIVVTGLLASPEEVRAARKAKEARRQQGKDSRGIGEDTKTDSFDIAPFSTPTMPRKPSTAALGDRKLRDSSPEVRDDPDSAAALETAPAPPASKLVELAILLNDPSQTRRAAAADVASAVDEDIDWNDMNWVPDPVDAGANYKRPKSEDVIGTLISALGSEDIFIKEFSAVVAERLLGEPARFDQELRVLELLKRRFGEAALQNCDVMIKDIQDSRRVDAAIYRTRGGGQTRLVLDWDAMAAAGGHRKEADEDVEYHARILSRLFWPGLEREHFLLPKVIVEQQRRYEKGYEDLKSGRKLSWLNQLGQARVELELSDRTVTADCTTVEATVIYAFQEDAAGPVRKSVEELYEQLQMDEDLITAALNFWVAKGVLLHRPGSQYYVVAETLEDSSAAADPAAASVPDHAAAAETEAEGPATTKNTSGGGNLSARERERREMYWRYIQGMLTNASATMPLGQIAMMMKMLIADGFPWSNEELQEFLEEKVAAGEMEIVGGKYKLKK
ncbi:Anaphase-promoting complex subunit 2 [Madurella mycetomatis]|uniref:Anaphase-promoting complex subunit 2 n=1 Tax=Madurella mycetomatis TaxID=100816 RepID=A0A175VNB6_9PEZI|nr:Anaphase-promoting complex subunit 2 [Madurella mycetomatis]